MVKIESGLTNLHAQAREGVGLEENISGSLSLGQTSQQPRIPFARVLVVCSGSLNCGNILLRFVGVNTIYLAEHKSFSNTLFALKENPERNREHMPLCM